MTNYGALAILALPPMPERQLRFLIAVETVKVGDDGLRRIGSALLARTAGISHNTLAKARADAVKAGHVEFERGDGRGNVSGYRILFPIKGTNIAGPLPAPERVPTGAPKGYQPSGIKGTSPNALTSGNANGALKALALEASALSLADLLRAAVPGAGEREIDYVITQIKASGEIRKPRAYLKTIIERGDAASLIAEAADALARGDAQDTPSNGSGSGTRLPWCGKCDERTRMTGFYDGTPGYCPDCSGRGRPRKENS